MNDDVLLADSCKSVCEKYQYELNYHIKSLVDDIETLHRFANMSDDAIYNEYMNQYCTMLKEEHIKFVKALRVRKYINNEIYRKNNPAFTEICDEVLLISDADAAVDNHFRACKSIIENIRNVKKCGKDFASEKRRVIVEAVKYDTAKINEYTVDYFDKIEMAKYNIERKDRVAKSIKDAAMKVGLDA